MSLGFHAFNENVRPQTTLRQRLDYYEEFTIPAARAHRSDQVVPTLFRERLPLLAKVTTPNRLLWFLVPLGVIAAFRARERLVLSSVLLVFIAFYALFAYLLPWYCIVVAPAVIVLVLLGKQYLERIRVTHRRTVSTVLTLGIIATAITALPGIDRETIDDGYPAP